jgi:hypothetical protein
MELLVVVEEDSNSLSFFYHQQKLKVNHILLDAAETVLGYFGFNGSIYRKSENRERGSKQKKWWDELREERRRDIEAERGN